MQTLDSACGSKVEVLAQQRTPCLDSLDSHDVRWCLASRDFEHLQCGGICGMTGAGCRLRMSHAMVLMTLLQNDSSSSDLGITWHLGRNTQEISEVPQLRHKITKSDVRPEIQNWSISLKKQGFMTK